MASNQRHIKTYLLTMRNLTLSLFFVILLSSCGGGGGGGGGHDSKMNYKNSEGVRLVHSALDGSPISAFLDGEPLSEEALPFNSISPFYSIKKGRHQLTIQEEGEGVQRKVYFDYNEGDRFTILFAGNNLTTSLILEPPSGSKKKESTCPTTFIHGVSDADSLEIMINGSSTGTIAPLSVSSPVSLALGDNQITLLSGQGSIVWKGSVVCKETESHSLVVSGQGGYFVTGNSVP
jgi:hypothetical protein